MGFGRKFSPDWSISEWKRILLRESDKRNKSKTFLAFDILYRPFFQPLLWKIWNDPFWPQTIYATILRDKVRKTLSLYYPNFKLTIKNFPGANWFPATEKMRSILCPDLTPTCYSPTNSWVSEGFVENCANLKSREQLMSTIWD